jgi:hypothetical protein
LPNTSNSSIAPLGGSGDGHDLTTPLLAILPLESSPDESGPQDLAANRPAGAAWRPSPLKRLNATTVFPTIGRNMEGATDMNKYSCTKSLSEEIYYATLIAESVQQAKQLAIDETNQKFSNSGGRPRDWSVRLLESDVEGPARILDGGYHEA